MIRPRRSLALSSRGPRAWPPARTPPSSRPAPVRHENWARKRAGGNGSTPAKFSSSSFKFNFKVKNEVEFSS